MNHAQVVHKRCLRCTRIISLMSTDKEDVGSAIVKIGIGLYYCPRCVLETGWFEKAKS